MAASFGVSPCKMVRARSISWSIDNTTISIGEIDQRLQTKCRCGRPIDLDAATPVLDVVGQLISMQLRQDRPKHYLDRSDRLRSTSKPPASELPPTAPKTRPRSLSSRNANTLLACAPICGATLDPTGTDAASEHEQSRPPAAERLPARSSGEVERRRRRRQRNSGQHRGVTVPECPFMRSAEALHTAAEKQRLVQTCERSLQIHRESLGAEHPSSVLEAARLTYALAKAGSLQGAQGALDDAISCMGNGMQLEQLQAWYSGLPIGTTVPLAQCSQEASEACGLTIRAAQLIQELME